MFFADYLGKCTAKKRKFTVIMPGGAISSIITAKFHMSDEAFTCMEWRNVPSHNQ